MKQHFAKPITEIIKNRHSVRTYNPETLDQELINKLKEYTAEIKGPFDSQVRLEIIDSLDLAEKSGGKIGTYGVIKGAKTFIAGVADKNERNMEQLGYCLEQLVLYAASYELGTCWLGGTFKRSQFNELVGLKENELIPVVTPVGHPADKRTLFETIMRRAAGSDNRKQWNELFFNGSFDKSLNQESAEQYAEVLEMVRLAPSASNKQPWRILKQGNEYHFYLAQAKGYGSALGFNIQKIDMGIAMCHFEMTAIEAELKGNWLVKAQSPFIGQTKDLEYIVSWIMQ
jgi:nitroreductase